LAQLRIGPRVVNGWKISQPGAAVLRKTPIWNCVCGAPRFAYNSKVLDVLAFRLNPARMNDFEQFARPWGQPIPRARAAKLREMK
jgi:hypothetical protein